ncbi:JNK1/MAPK8-associated membrane protein-like isoform X2 [Mytilus trossulus]|uniref:JNK1/MAPK8-associated membrane protein-like isoform X2 n=1 Tax=Mytilus trossulus TaxID=6551 RepID=UPI003004AC43
MTNKNTRTSTNVKQNMLKFLILFPVIYGVSFGQKVSEKCPGLYCGRTLQNGTLSNCGACVRGYQPDDSSENSICKRCEEEPSFYDWLFLGFMALLSLLLHWFFIDFTNRRKNNLIILHVSAFIESVLSGIVTILLVDPIGTFNIRSCKVKQLSDWYSMLYNPSPNYTTTLHCTQEIVYPLYTICMIYYAFSLLFMMLFRPLISYRCVDTKGTKSIYAALYFHPILIVLQAMFGGLLYYAFPYIMLVISLVTSAAHLASTNVLEVKQLFKNNFCDARNLIILVGHWILHAYAIISMTQLTNLTFHLSLLATVPLPVFFYICTVKFTDPDYVERVSHVDISTNRYSAEARGTNLQFWNT